MRWRGGAAPMRRAGVPVLVALASVGIAPAAHADPIQDQRAQAAAIQQRLDAMNAHIEALDEQYNEAQLRVAAANSAVTQAQQRVASSDHRLAAAKAGLSEQAVVAYIRGTPPRAIAPSTDPGIRQAYIREM